MVCFLLYTRVESRASVIPISFSGSEDFLKHLQCLPRLESVEQGAETAVVGRRGKHSARLATKMENWKYPSCADCLLIVYFCLEFLVVDHGILESARVGVLAGEWNDISHEMQVEFEAARDDWSSSDWIRTKEPSVQRGTGVLHSLAYHDDAAETVPRHTASLKPPVFPRYHWLVRKYHHHKPCNSR
jgi:hypothetical protein